MTKKTITLCKDAQDYLTSVLKGKVLASADVIKQCKLVKNAFDSEDLIFKQDRYDAYMRIGELMFEEVFPWERFIVACTLCTYRKNGQPRWDDILCLMGRGNGKDGLIAFISLCLISKHNPVKNYDVDICANNEDQSTRPVKDVIDFLERPGNYERNKKSFHWTLEGVTGKDNKGKIKGHTNSPKGKDGLRSGCVILNEIHQYENYANIDVFTTGLGKKPERRLFMFTTNGNVRDGVLDNKLREAESVLNEDVVDEGRFYFLAHLDDREEVDEQENWVKANPSLPYLPSLLTEMQKEYRVWKDTPYNLPGFMTKRMNMPEVASEKAVVGYDYIKDTNREMPDLTGTKCVCGVDLSRTTDMCSVSLLFRGEGNIRYVINHNWICTQSNDWGAIKVKDQFPKWVEMGLLTIVDDVEINPDLIAQWINRQKAKYVITKICIDDFRQSIFAYDLQKIGFSKVAKNLKLVRPSDIARVVPVIESTFLQNGFVWGDNPVLRWATNNTKVVPWKTKNTEDSELGNSIYAKIEKHARKTDPFMSLVAAMTCDSELSPRVAIDPALFRVRTV